MKLNTGMILFTFILLKISYFTNSLPMLDETNNDNIPAYARAPQAEIKDTEVDEEEDDELSGDFSDDYEGDGIMRDFYVMKKKKHHNVWKVNLNKTKDKLIFQGDIRLSLIQNLKMEVDKNLRIKRAARSKEPDYLWKQNTIYYKIDSVFDRDTKLEIKRGIRHWKRTMKNCLKFIRLDKSKELENNISRDHFAGGPVNHILFTKTDTGCWSQVGRTDTVFDGRLPVVGQQLISIGAGCGEKGTVIHEIGHAIGFWHEQSRRDRDNFVRIVKNNIMEDQKQQFKRMARAQVGSMGYAYDFGSVMHYGPTFFSNNGRPTIKILKRYRYLKPDMGQRNSLSFLDIAQVRAMYKCNALPSLESKRTCVNKKTKGRDYRGNLDYTEKGVMCQPWYKQYPHSHKYKLNNPLDGLGRHNSCRNPGGEKQRPWCFTTYGKDMKSTWQYCDLKDCNS